MGNVVPFIIGMCLSSILFFKVSTSFKWRERVWNTFSVNQMLYLFIAMWIYPTVPEKMLMVIAMIFGAHLLPYSWLYKSKTYMILSFIIPVISLIIGLKFEPYIIAIVMVIIEIIFSISLIIENKKI